MENEWKKGDKLRVKDGQGSDTFRDGTILDFDSYRSSDFTMCNVIINGAVNGGWNCSRFELIKSNDKYKEEGREFIVMDSSCNNIIQKNLTYDEAIKLIPQQNQKYTIYKLLAVATIEPTTKLTKIKEIEKTKKEKR